MGQKNNSTTAMKWEQLTEKERYKIEGLFKLGLTPAQIGKQIGKSKRTMERERKLGKEQLMQYENWVNNYPRKIFGYKTANKMAA